MRGALSENKTARQEGKRKLLRCNKTHCTGEYWDVNRFRRVVDEFLCDCQGASRKTTPAGPDDAGSVESIRRYAVWTEVTAQARRTATMSARVAKLRFPGSAVTDAEY